MVGSIERIEQDLATLDKATTAIAEEFYNAYSDYLTVLGKAARQQLILASYHVCTQDYPEQFLRLSYSQRQQLQDTLKQLAHQVQEELLAQLHKPIVPEETEESNSPPDPASAANYPYGVLDLEFSAPPVQQTSTSSSQSLTPFHLAQWREDIEQAIVGELRTASYAANRLLQQSGVLPRRLPEPVLEAATKADVSEIGGANTPNLLNVLVETVKEHSGEVSEETIDAEEFKGHMVMHVVAIHLRLAEIEFADATVAAARSKIRNLIAQLKTLGREYQKKQRERAIAEAQAAWRSSWSDD